MTALFSWLVGVLVLASVGLAQNNVTVEESDPRLQYNPWPYSWGKYSNPITLTVNGVPTTFADYFHGGGYVAISSYGANVTMTFNGSWIGYYSDTNNNHGSMQVTLDGVEQPSFSTYSSNPQPQLLLFSASVDPNVPNHVITLTCLESKGMGLDYFMFTSATPAVTTTSTSSTGSASSGSATGASSTGGSKDGTSSTGGASPTGSSGSQTNTVASHHSDAPTIAAGVVAAIGWFLALLCALLLFRIRRRLNADAKPADTERPMSEAQDVRAFPMDHPSVVQSDAVPRPSFSGKGPRIFGAASSGSSGPSSSGNRFSQAVSHVSPPAYSDQD